MRAPPAQTASAPCRLRFGFALTGFAMLLFAYGLQRLTLGVDFTDEGAYVAWPLRTLFGERPFTGELLTLLRPVFFCVGGLYRLYPDISLYELRLLGWLIHIGAFCVLATCVFQLCRAPFQSLAIAGIPFFTCHIFGLAPPSYYSLATDFLVIAFSLRTLARPGRARARLALQLGGGTALFLATLAHPALGLVGAVLGLYEVFGHRLLQNLLRRRPAASNAGFLAFAGCWAAFGLYLLATGAAADWLHRVREFPAVKGLRTLPDDFLLRLLPAPFACNSTARAFSAAALVLAFALWLAARARDRVTAARAAAVLAFVLAVSLVRTWVAAPESLPLVFAMVALVAGAVCLLRLRAPFARSGPPLRFLFAASFLGALALASATTYFNPLRSWQSGILALPFAFSAGLALLLRPAPDRVAKRFRALTLGALVIALAGIAHDHHEAIQRDAPPARLTAPFRTPRLRHLRSTPERTGAVDALYDYLHPRLARGERLLAYDDCPMLYFILDAMPAYNLTWATRSTPNHAELVQLDAEFRAQPLPHYAIRVMVDLSKPVWKTARRTSYANYPLNETVERNYQLERVIFPFEIWRLKADAPPGGPASGG